MLDHCYWAFRVQNKMICGSCHPTLALLLSTDSGVIYRLLPIAMASISVKCWIALNNIRLVSTTCHSLMRSWVVKHNPCHSLDIVVLKDHRTWFGVIWRRSVAWGASWENRDTCHRTTVWYSTELENSWSFCQTTRIPIKWLNTQLTLIRDWCRIIFWGD